VLRTVSPIVDPSKDIARARAHLVERRGASRQSSLGVYSRGISIPGANPTPGLLFGSRAAPPLRPGILWIHGGGFTMGSVDVDEPLCRRLAAAVDAVVLSVEYRLAPEWTFPAALDDVYAALAWMHANAEKLGVDAGRIAIVGQSAGGALAAGATLLARDRGEIAVAYQVLLYPCLDDRLTTRSSREILDPRTWNRSLAAGSWKAYLGNVDGESVSPYAAPSRATDLSRLPPTYVMVGAIDMLRDENVEYASRLMQSNVPVELHVYPGAFHGFDLLAPDATVSRRATDEWHGALRRALCP
jgi:acetyl esterase/lipase